MCVYWLALPASLAVSTRPWLPWYLQALRLKVTFCVFLVNLRRCVIAVAVAEIFQVFVTALFNFLLFTSQFCWLFVSLCAYFSSYLGAISLFSFVSPTMKIQKSFRWCSLHTHNAELWTLADDIFVLLLLRVFVRSQMFHSWFRKSSTIEKTLLGWQHFHFSHNFSNWHQLGDLIIAYRCPLVNSESLKPGKGKLCWGWITQKLSYNT